LETIPFFTFPSFSPALQKLHHVTSLHIGSLNAVPDILRGIASDSLFPQLESLSIDTRDCHGASEAFIALKSLILERERLGRPIKNLVIRCDFTEDESRWVCEHVADVRIISYF